MEVAVLSITLMQPMRAFGCYAPAELCLLAFHCIAEICRGHPDPTRGRFYPGSGAKIIDAAFRVPRLDPLSDDP